MGGDMQNNEARVTEGALHEGWEIRTRTRMSNCSSVHSQPITSNHSLSQQMPSFTKKDALTC